MRIYNSLSRRVETFSPRSPKAVKMYACGPTVYARPHIGNLRTYVFEDALKRYLLYSGFRVKHVMNITDIDETVLKEARKMGSRRADLVRKYEQLFRQDCSALGILPASAYPHVSKYVGEMAKNAVRLEKGGLAYRDEKCRIFFDISKFPTYGKLAGKRIRAQRKVMREEYKPSQAGDFLLLSRCGQGQCDRCNRTKIGMCKPAWNVQCATMSLATLGCGIDIAMGGQDNCFNHHENTRAIGESLCGRKYAGSWMHVRHLIINGRKMSKSRGNAVLLPDLLARGFSAREARMILLSVHYRRRMDFTWEYARSVKMRWLNIRKAVNALKDAGGNDREGFARFASDARADFEAALDGNMDIPSALAVSEKFARECAGAGLSKKQAREALALLRKFDSVLMCLPLQ